MPEKLQTIVFLVRHGQTDNGYSLDGAVDDQRHLTELGRQQSVRVGQFLDQFQPAAIYCSPMARCQEMAKIIKTETGFTGEIITTPKLAEIYSTEPRQEAGERGESVFQTILTAHAGRQVVAVSHQYIIGYAVADFLGITYQQVPCDFAAVYRFVFAGTKLVEVTHLQPTKVGNK